jgi:Alpha-L-arabinofuranosidase B, catalytic
MASLSSLSTRILRSSSLYVAAGLVACGSSQSGGGSDENSANGGMVNTGATSSTPQGGGSGNPTISGASGSGVAPTGGSGGVAPTGGSGGVAPTSGSGGFAPTSGSGGVAPTSGSGGGPVSGAGGGSTKPEGGASGVGNTTGGAGGSGGAGPSGGSGGMATGSGVCDLFATGNTPCVAAHSTVRALYSAYNGNLYQVSRASDKTTKDIGVLSAGGFADSATQDTFCAGTTCTISIIYDQSGDNNHLKQGPAGQRKESVDNLADAAALKLTLSGHTVYGVHLPVGYGYRVDVTKGVAIADLPETEYMVTSGTFFNGACCFDYGNAETNNRDDGAGTMEAVYFGNWTGQGKGAGTGPWVMADMENGVFAQASFAANAMDTPRTSAYVTAMVIGRSGTFALKGGNAQTGTLTTFYDGVRPKGYEKMTKQGAIVLGVGGDNTATAQGNFFEGVLTSGAASDATVNAVQTNIVAAGYGM